MTADQRFLVVTGTMRSGTSLIACLLKKRENGHRAHPLIAFSNDDSKEIKELFSQLRRTLGDGTVGFGEVDATFELTDKILDALGVTHGPLADRIAVLRERIIVDILRHCPQGPMPTIFGLKRTSLNYGIGLFDQLFRDVSVVFTLRDPRDVLVSHARRINVDVSSGNALLILAYILSNYAMIARMRESKRPMHVLKYESVVADPVASMTKVLEFVGADPDLYDFEGILGESVPSNSSFGVSGGRGFVEGAGISTKSIGKHRDLLAQDVRRFVDAVCGEIIDAFGYASESDTRCGEWDDGFEPLVTAMRISCKLKRISTKAVDSRLRVLGAPDRLLD